MGILDLRCSASRLPLLGGLDPLCTCVVLIGVADGWEPACLPVVARWSESRFDELREDDHARHLQRGLPDLLALLEAGTGLPLPSAPDALTDIMRAIWSAQDRGSPIRVGERKRPLGVAVVLHELYARAASTSPTPSEQDLSRLPWASTLYPSPRPDLARHGADFDAFRAWFEARDAWLPVGESEQFHDDEVGAGLTAFETFLSQHPELGSRPFDYVEELADYLAAGEDDDDDDDDGDWTMRLERGRLRDHIAEKLRSDPTIGDEQLARSIEMFRMLKAVPSELLTNHGDMKANVRVWLQSVERWDRRDADTLVAELTARG